MYTVINENAGLIVNSITQNHIDNYDFLIQNFANLHEIEYRQRYKRFWGLNAARPNEIFLENYFKFLDELRKGTEYSLEFVALSLYNIPFNNKGNHTLQFSFSTKMIHMIYPNLPIYDSLVRAFFFFDEPNRNFEINTRIERFMNFFNYLIEEYERILNDNLLAETIQLFREQKNPQYFTDQKIIDSIIWGFVNCLNTGNLVNGNIRFI